MWHTYTVEIGLKKFKQSTMFLFLCSRDIPGAARPLSTADTVENGLAMRDRSKVDKILLHYLSLVINTLYSLLNLYIK